jgi:molybdopterin-binding protein
MKLSTRNQLQGTVADLGLENGKSVTVLVKATEVMLATD